MKKCLQVSFHHKNIFRISINVKFYFFHYVIITNICEFFLDVSCHHMNVCLYQKDVKMGDLIKK